jgi:hypothetical protein
MQKAGGHGVAPRVAGEQLAQVFQRFRFTGNLKPDCFDKFSWQAKPKVITGAARPQVGSDALGAEEELHLRVAEQALDLRRERCFLERFARHEHADAAFGEGIQASRSRVVQETVVGE